MVYLDLRRVVPTLIVMGPLVSGTLLTLAGMFLLGMKLNPANFIALPIILGMGVMSGANIMQRFLGGNPLGVVLLRTGRAVNLQSMATAIGSGSLALSSYQGFSSLGLIMVAGVAFCHLTAMALQPALMTLLLIHPRPMGRQIRDVLDEVLAFRRH